MKTKEPPEIRLYSELITIYECLEVELMKLNPVCKQCGTCCKFSIFGHVLYTTNIEVSFITQHVDVPEFDASKNVCPFLKNNQCSIRDFRTLGCRIFYCNPQFKEASHDLYEKYYRMMKDLSHKYNTQWEYLPFLNQLIEYKSKLSVHASKPEPSMPSHS